MREAYFAGGCFWCVTPIYKMYGVELTLLLEIVNCAKEDSQFIIVTHSPILLGIPGAEILSFDDGRVHPIPYEDTDSYQVTKRFIENKEQLLKRLLSD